MRTTFLYDVVAAAEKLLFTPLNFIQKNMQSEDFSPKDYYILVETMRRYGGHFCSKLADAIAAGDLSNKRKIIAAFPDLVSEYGPGSKFAKLTQSEFSND